MEAHPHCTRLTAFPSHLAQLHTIAPSLTIPVSMICEAPAQAQAHGPAQMRMHIITGRRPWGLRVKPITIEETPHHVLRNTPPHEQALR